MNTCEMGAIDLSDHAPVYLSVDLNLQPKTNNWKLNSSLLNCPHFEEQIKREIHFYLEINANGDVPSNFVGRLKGCTERENYSNILL